MTKQKKNPYTTIRIDNNTHSQLVSFGKKGETFDETLRKIILRVKR